jgi:hypothetical protein
VERLVETIPFWLPLAWLAAVATASVAYRTRRDRPIFPAVPPDALYRETFASGASRKNLWTRLGGASNCLLVGVTADELVIAPWFPFDLFFLPEIYDLEHYVPRHDVLALRSEAGLIRASTVVTLRLADGGEREIALRLRDGQAFARALGLPLLG